MNKDVSKYWKANKFVPNKEKVQECIMCSTKIFFDTKLNAPINAVNLLSFAGPCSKYQHGSQTYSVPKGEMFLVCDTCYEKIISKSIRFDEMLNNDKVVAAELPKIRPHFEIQEKGE